MVFIHHFCYQGYELCVHKAIGEIYTLIVAKGISY